jgi:hypothetical protein
MFTIAGFEQGTMNLRKELCQKIEQEIRLELKHIGIETAIAVAMTFNIQVQLSRLTGLDSLYPMYQLEQYLGLLFESLVTVNDMVYRNCPVIGFEP